MTSLDTHMYIHTMTPHLYPCQLSQEPQGVRAGWLGSLTSQVALGCSWTLMSLGVLSCEMEDSWSGWVKSRSSVPGQRPCLKFKPANEEKMKSCDKPREESGEEAETDTHQMGWSGRAYWGRRLVS